MREPSVFEMRAGRVVLNSTLVLDGVDFRLGAGEFLALLGANGSGKTTLVRALLGLVPLAGGSLRINGRKVRRPEPGLRIGYVPQRGSASSGAPASVIEIVLSGRIGRARPLQPYRAADRDAARHALEVLGLADLASVPVTQLSGGEQQRVLIARAVAGEPDVLVLDEPMSGVDLEHQERLAGTLKDFNQHGGSILLVAHGLGPMEELITREVVMHGGRVSYDGPHHPHHVHIDQVHHPETQIERSPLDRAAEGS
jgi:zinc transport system ATP-binding protein